MKTLEELQQEAIDNIEAMVNSNTRREMIENQIRLAYTVGRVSAIQEAQKLIAS